MRLTLTVPAAVIAAYAIHALPIAHKESLGEILARSAPELDNDTLQLNQRGTDVGLPLQIMKPTEALTVLKTRFASALAAEAKVPPADLNKRSPIVSLSSSKILAATSDGLASSWDSVSKGLDRIKLDPHEPRSPWGWASGTKLNQEADSIKIGKNWINLEDVQVRERNIKDGRLAVGYVSAKNRDKFRVVHLPKGTELPDGAENLSSLRFVAPKPELPQSPDRSKTKLTQLLETKLSLSRKFSRSSKGQQSSNAE